MIFFEILWAQSWEIGRQKFQNFWILVRKVHNFAFFCYNWLEKCLDVWCLNRTWLFNHEKTLYLSKLYKVRNREPRFDFKFWISIKNNAYEIWVFEACVSAYFSKIHFHSFWLEKWTNLVGKNWIQANLYSSQLQLLPSVAKCYYMITWSFLKNFFAIVRLEIHNYKVKFWIVK